MDKIKIAFGYLAYPFTMANYFRRALERRHDVELYTFGQFTGQYIPWNGGMQIPPKYMNHVDLPFPQGMNTVSWNSVNGQLPWKPDLVLNVDAGFHLSSKPPDVPYAVVATDPHVLGDWYKKVRPMTDYFFNMQPSYLQAGDILLPYAYDPTVHYPMPHEKPEFFGLSNTYTPLEYDCCIVGLHYPQRDEWVSQLRGLGIKVNYRIGDIYDEYREENNRAWIGLNWSSLQDVTARVFEIMSMKLVPVLNRLDGLNALGFEEDRHYLGFSSMEEAVEKVQWALANRPQANQIALGAYQFVNNQSMTWDKRVEQILSATGLL